MKQLLILVIVLFNIFIVNAQTNKSFTIKNSKNLPAWFDNVERQYTLNDDRLIDDSEELQFIGGFTSQKGETFFINNSELVFSESQIQIKKIKNVITKTFSSGDYLVEMIWDTALTTGSYSEGTIRLIYKNILQFSSNLIISEF